MNNFSRKMLPKMPALKEKDILRRRVAELEARVSQMIERLNVAERDAQAALSGAKRAEARANDLAKHAIQWCRVTTDLVPVSGMYLLEQKETTNYESLKCVHHYQEAGKPWRSGTLFFFGPIPERVPVKREVKS